MRQKENYRLQQITDLKSKLPNQQTTQKTAEKCLLAEGNEDPLPK